VRKKAIGQSKDRDITGAKGRTETSGTGKNKGTIRRGSKISRCGLSIEQPSPSRAKTGESGKGTFIKQPKKIFRAGDKTHMRYPSGKKTWFLGLWEKETLSRRFLK